MFFLDQIKNGKTRPKSAQDVFFLKQSFYFVPKNQTFIYILTVNGQEKLCVVLDCIALYTGDTPLYKHQNLPNIFREVKLQTCIRWCISGGKVYEGS